MRPVICAFYELVFALRVLHGDDPGEVARLHDIWKLGAPTPDSRLLAPKGYDERFRQPGNVEQRAVPGGQLAAWIDDVVARRGLAISPQEATALARRLARILGNRTARYK